MGKSLTTNQKTEIAKSVLKTRTLISITLDSSTKRILVNDSVANLIIGGNTYNARLVQMSDIETSLDGNGEKITIIVSDIAQEFAGLIADGGDVLTNKSCKVEEIIFNGDPNARKNSNAYSLGNFVVPSALNSYIYECTTAGTSNSSEPTWPTTIGNTVNDGTAVWTCRSPIIDSPVLLFDGLINNIQLSQYYCGFDVERPLYSYSTVSPNMTYDINCQFKFKDSRCQYAGAESKCDKTLTRCQALSNVTRFGGYPSVVTPVNTK